MSQYVIPPWLNMPTEKQPTEVLMPLSVQVGPVWDHQRKEGGWFAAIVVNLPLDLDPLWECGHTHVDRTEAWACGHGAAGQLAEELIQQREHR